MSSGVCDPAECLFHELLEDTEKQALVSAAVLTMCSEKEVPVEHSKDVLALAERQALLGDDFTLYSLVYILVHVKWAMGYVMERSCTDASSKEFGTFLYHYVAETKHIIMTEDNEPFVIETWAANLREVASRTLMRSYRKTRLSLVISTHTEEEDDDDPSEKRH